METVCSGVQTSVATRVQGTDISAYWPHEASDETWEKMPLLKDAILHSPVYA